MDVLVVVEEPVVALRRVLAAAVQVAPGPVQVVACIETSNICFTLFIIYFNLILVI